MRNSAYNAIAAIGYQMKEKGITFKKANKQEKGTWLENLYHLQNCKYETLKKKLLI